MTVTLITSPRIVSPSPRPLRVPVYDKSRVNVSLITDVSDASVGP